MHVQLSAVAAAAGLFCTDAGDFSVLRLPQLHIHVASYYIMEFLMSTKQGKGLSFAIDILPKSLIGGPL